MTSIPLNAYLEQRAYSPSGGGVILTPTRNFDLYVDQPDFQLRQGDAGPDIGGDEPSQYVQVEMLHADSERCTAGFLASKLVDLVASKFGISADSDGRHITLDRHVRSTGDVDTLVAAVRDYAAHFASPEFRQMVEAAEITFDRLYLPNLVGTEPLDEDLGLDGI